MSAARPSAPREIRFRRLGAGARAGIASLLAAGVLLAANALSARLYAHWTYRGAAALSPETLRLLQGTTGTFEIDALFEHDHPYRTAVRDLLREYEEAARTIPSLDIRVRSIDSNRDLPETVELLRRYPVPENSVVVVHGGSYRAMDEFELAAPAAPGPALRPVIETPVPEGTKPPKDVWNDALKYLKKNEPAIFAPLARGKYGGFQNGVYRALFAPEDGFFLTMLQAPDRVARVENALRQCGGGEAKFEALSQQLPPDPEKDARQQQNMDQLIGTFGRDKVQIDE